MNAAGLSFRDGAAADLEETFAMSERTVYEAAARQGILPPDRPPTDAEIRSDWRRKRGLIEFIAARPGARYLVCEDRGQLVAYARVVPFSGVEELTELMVRPDHQGTGLGRALLRRCWPGDPGPDLARLVIAAGAPADLTLYTAFGVRPVAGHWHMRLRTERYLEARAGEGEAGGVPAHVLEPDHALAEWDRLEPQVIGYKRPELHDFFARSRFCLACLDEATGEASALCWVSTDGDIGPAVAVSARALPPVVLAALDRVARGQEPEYVSVFTTTAAPRLLERLRGLGFRVWWPSWILSSSALPGLDRYAPTRPPHLL